MSPNESPVRRLVAQQAAEWHVACREGLTPTQSADFAEWLKASPLHVEEYLGISQVAGDLRGLMGSPAAGAPESIEAIAARARGAAEPVFEDDTIVPFPAHRAGPSAGAARPRALRQVAGWAAAAAVLAVAVTAWLYQPAAASTHHETLHGQHLATELADSSALTLDADSAVDVTYGDDERHVALLRGQAMFQVAHDTDRPFNVVAGAVTVTAVGTQFDVDRRGDATVVTVVEGRVRVALGHESATVGAGEQLRVVGGAALPQPARVDALRATAWMQGQVYFDNEPLAEVAAEVSRYASLPIEVLGDELRALPISGAVGAKDTSGFLAFVRSLEGVRVRESADRVVVEAQR